MFEWTREWIRLRREHPAMRSGRLIDLFYDDDAYVFARQLGAETVIVAFNRDRKDKRVTIALRDAAGLEALIGEVKARVIKGEAELDLPAQSATALRAF
jgi:alpha-glucosidase